jgi:hypothetical protein
LEAGKVKSSKPLRFKFADQRLFCFAGLYSAKEGEKYFLTSPRQPTNMAKKFTLACRLLVRCLAGFNPGYDDADSAAVLKSPPLQMRPNNFLCFEIVHGLV